MKITVRLNALLSHVDRLRLLKRSKQFYRCQEFLHGEKIMETSKLINDTKVYIKKDLANTRSYTIVTGNEYPVPPYIVGKNKIFVFVNGTHLIGSIGTITDGVSYCEVGDTGEISSSIQFAVDIIPSDDIFICVLDGIDEALDDPDIIGTVMTLGSDVTNYGVTTPKVVSKITDTETLLLDTQIATGITHDYEEKSTKKLVSAFALRTSNSVYDQKISNIQNSVDNLVLSSVLSEAIADPSFVDIYWKYSGFTIDEGTAVYTNAFDKPGINQANIRLVTEAIKSPGTYFFDVEIGELADGSDITLFDNEGKVIKKFELAGTYWFEYQVTNPAIAYFDFVANNVLEGSTIRIKRASIHHIRDDFDTYMNYIAIKLASGGSGFVTTEAFNQTINELRTELQKYTNDVVGGFEGLIEVHTSNTSNPHNVTAAQTGAAAKTDFDAHVNNTNNPHKVTATQIGAALSSDLTAHTTNLNNPHKVTAAQLNVPTMAQFNSHINDTNNPHNVTAKQLGVPSLEEFTDSMEELNSHLLDNNNPHKVTKIQVGLSNIPNSISDSTDLDSNETLATSKAVFLLKTDFTNRISDHIDNFENPHKVTKKQVGLGNLPNATTDSMYDSDVETLVVAKVTNDILKMIQSHEGDLNNPHNVTKEQLGIGNIPTETTDSMYDASTDKIPVAKVTNDLYLYISDHVGSRDNPHNVTTEQIKAAPLEHTHKVADITDISTITNQLAELNTRIINTETKINLHTANFENPHEVNKQQVELGNVENYSVASVEEATEGLVDDKYMTPAKVRSFVESLFSTSGVEFSKLQTTYISHFTLDNETTTSARFSIKKGRTYKLKIEGSDPRNIALRIDKTRLSSSGDIVRNSICYPKTLTVGNSTVTAVGCDNISLDHFILIPSTAGMNYASGEISIDTFGMVVDGVLNSRVLDDSGSPVVDYGFPVIISSGYISTSYFDSVLDLTSLHVEIKDTSITTDMKFTLYELIQPAYDMTVSVIDNTPVGSIIRNIKSTAPVGYAALDGATLSRANNSELFKIIQDEDILIEQTEYDQAIADSGECQYFGSGDGLTTFTMPTEIKNTNSIYYSYMKLKTTNAGDSIGQVVIEQSLANTRTEVISANTEYVVPEYTVGKNNLFVFINGLHAMGGFNPANPNTVTYSEVGIEKQISNTIKFHDDILINYDLCFIVLR